MNDHQMGYDVKAKQICNLMEANIVDPTKVVKSSLRYASGVVSILLTADAAVIEEDLTFTKVHEQLKL